MAALNVTQLAQIAADAENIIAMPVADPWPADPADLPDQASSTAARISPSKHAWGQDTMSSQADSLELIQQANSDFAV